MPRAVAAEPVKRDFVPIQPESLGGHAGDIAGAFFHIERPAAVVAAEMVVVPFARQFVAGGLAGQFDGHDLAQFFQGPDCSVDGRQTQRRDLFPG